MSRLASSGLEIPHAKKAREILPEVGAQKWVDAIRTMVPQ